MPEVRNRKIAIVDYGMGNLFSVSRACHHAGMECIITSVPTEIEAAAGVILPGVGAFGEAMKRLNELKLISVLQSVQQREQPFLGICLGCQLMLSESEEFGKNKGLGLFSGKVKHLGEPQDGTRRLKVPHVGWNRIRFDGRSRSDDKYDYLASIADNSYMYFVHSYFVEPEEKQYLICETEYGDRRFCSAFGNGLVFGCQFHPERSGSVGLKIYENFAKLIEIQHIQA